MFFRHFEKENEHAHNEGILARAFLPVPRLPIFSVSARVKKKAQVPKNTRPDLFTFDNLSGPCHKKAAPVPNFTRAVPFLCKCKWAFSMQIV